MINAPASKLHHFSVWAIALCLATIAALAVVWLMQHLTNKEAALASKDYEYDVVDFVRLKKESEAQTKKRERPEKPKPLEKPVQKNLEVSQLDSPASPDFQFDMPDMALPSGLSDGPQISLPAFGMAKTNTEPNRNVRPISRVNPRYPLSAQRRGIEGYVLLQFTITQTGAVTDIEVVDSTPPKVFDAAAKRALARWKFKPKMVDDTPVTQFAEVKINFALN